MNKMFEKFLKRIKKELKKTIQSEDAEKELKKTLEQVSARMDLKIIELKVGGEFKN